MRATVEDLRVSNVGSSVMDAKHNRVDHVTFTDVNGTTDGANSIPSAPPQPSRRSTRIPDKKVIFDN